MEPQYSIGPQTAKAWLLTVINPSIKALKTEKEYLDKGNLTWRAQPGDFELIGRFGESIELQYFPNYEHFLFLNPDVMPRIGEYARRTDALRDVSRNLQDVIERSPELVQVYEKTTSETELKRLPVSIEDVFRGDSMEHRLRYLAQLIVNCMGELPNYYTVSAFWNANHDRFLSIRKSSAIGPLDERQAAARLAMLHTVSDLIDTLTAIRNNLVQQFDVPPAPLESVL